METRNFLSIPKNNNITSLSIGKFEGLHLGHQQILSKLYAESKRGNSAKCAVLIINNHSFSFITSPKDRLERLANSYILDLEEIKELEGKAFIDLLMDKLPNLKRIVVGYDFRFGKHRAFGLKDLQSMFLGQIITMPLITYNDIPIHSSVIKGLITHGDIRIARAMLGWDYAILGEVIRGQGLGKKRLVPTINVDIGGYVAPASGVYATKANGDNAVSFVGNRLSLDSSFALETHILDKNIDCAPKTLRIEFIEKIRDNQFFNDLNDLKNQIYKDIESAKNIFSM